MAKNFFVIFLVCLALVLTESLYRKSTYESHFVGKKDKIIEGSDAKIEDYPYHIYMRTPMPGYDYSLCGGSIITAEHILTAAHCLKYVDTPSDIKVFTEIDKLSEENVKNSSFIHFAKNFTVHPEYDASIGKKEHDIAIITLSKPINFNDKQRVIDLPDKNVEMNVTGNIAGFGRINNYPYINAEKLQVVKMTTVPSEDCAILNDRFRDDSHFCVMGVTYMGSVCNGDSGGALAINNTIIGIVAFVSSAGCGFGLPTGFVDVYKHLDFIESVINT